MTHRLHLVCGDRHRQYHALHPSGIEEFSCGAGGDANARKEVFAGTGTDPNTLIEQPYLQRQSSGKKQLAHALHTGFSRANRGMKKGALRKRAEEVGVNASQSKGGLIHDIVRVPQERN